MYLVHTCMPGAVTSRRFKSLLLCPVSVKYYFPLLVVSLCLSLSLSLPLAHACARVCMCVDCFICNFIAYM